MVITIFKQFSFRKYLNKSALILGAVLFFIPLMVYAGAPDIGQMMQNLKRDLPHLVKFIAAVSYTGGVWFIFSALHELRIYGQARTMMPTNVNLSGPVIRLMIGVLMMFFPSFIDVSIYTIWNYGSQDVLLYPSDIKAGWQDIIQGVVALTRVIGYIAFVRGLILITRSSRQGVPPGMLGKAITHIVGGILAINIVGTIDAVKGTFGWT